MQLTLTLPMADDGGSVSVRIADMDAFHPDQLAETVALFESLLDLRRNLASRAGFDRAAKEVLSWSGEAPLPPTPRHARGAAVATDRKLSDFARLIGRPATTDAAERSVDDMMRRIVGPFVQPGRDARQEQLTARVDEALSAAMRRVLHHPDFQAAEATWRGVDMLVRRVETGARTEIVLYDVSAEELAADLAATDALEETGLYGMLVEQPALDAHQGALSAVVGLYGFELTPPHADLLARAAQVAAAAGAPFVAGIGPDALAMPFHEQHPLIKDAWTALHSLPEAAYLGLATPRFLLRMPYGRKSDPIDAFAFEEFSRQSGLSGMLWGHPALLAGLLLAQTWEKQGAKMQLGAIAGIGDMPYYVYTDPDGDPVALPCTERLYSERQAVQVATYRVMPVLSLRGRPEVRLGGFASLAGSTLAGFWAPVAFSADGAAPLRPRRRPHPPKQPRNRPPLPPRRRRPNSTRCWPACRRLPSPCLRRNRHRRAEPADDLDALLASLNVEPPPQAADATEPDLDALLASLG